ncbi:MAG: M48 family metalloprotease [Deltaproteobacteria bacterium]|nr:M48 family metalloprotease [Deltaproteobacteria bacterium]
MRIRNLVLFSQVLFFCWSCAYVPMAVKEDVPLLEEVAVGNMLFPWAVQKMGGVCNDSELLVYVEGVGQKLAKYAGRSEVTYHFQVVNSSLPGAFVFPGGYIGISRGLMLRLENETQLAAILGHLIAHVEDFHLNDALRDSKLYLRFRDQTPDEIDSLSFNQSVVAAQDLVAQLLAWQFTLRQERDADQIAVNYLNQTGYNPRGILWLMDAWSGAQGSFGGHLQPHAVCQERWINTKRYVDNFLSPGNRSRYLGEAAYARATVRLRQNSQGLDYFDEGMKLEKRGDLNGAVAFYLQAAAEASDDPLILCRLGLAYLQAEDLHSAGHYLRQAVRLSPNYYYSRLGMGYCLLEDDQPDQALVHLEAAMRLLPTIEGAFLLAEAYERQGKVGQAANLYADVVRAEPSGKLGRRAAERGLQMKNN